MATPPYTMVIPENKAYEVLFASSAIVFLFLTILSIALVEVVKGVGSKKIA